MENEQDFQHESVEDKESLVKYLQTLSDGFLKGRIEFKSGQDKIILTPRGLIQIELEVKSRNKKSKLSMKFSWKDQPLPKKEKKLLIRANHE